MGHSSEIYDQNLKYDIEHHFEVDPKAFETEFGMGKLLLLGVILVILVLFTIAMMYYYVEKQKTDDLRRKASEGN